MVSKHKETTYMIMLIVIGVLVLFLYNCYSRIEMYAYPNVKNRTNDVRKFVKKNKNYDKLIKKKRGQMGRNNLGDLGFCS